MIDFLEICRRAAKGKMMPQKEFDQKVYYPKIKELTKKVGNVFGRATIVNTDDGIADLIYEAAIELISDVGVYCTDTERIINFTREEVIEAIKNAPGPTWFGEDDERKLFKPRSPDDYNNPAWAHVGSGVAVSNEDIAFKTVEGYARIQEADSVAIPSLSHLRTVPVGGGSPVEILATIRANMTARHALMQAGRPGMPIMNMTSTASSAVGTIAASVPMFGARKSDGWIVAFLPELKVDFGSLDKVAYLLSWGAHVGPESSPILGGFAGGPIGTAITNVAYIIAGILVMKGKYQLTFPMDMRFSCSTTRNILWAVGTSSQAISRNISFPVLSLGYIGGGPMTENYFYESAAYILTAVSSGSSAQTPIPAKAVVTDHQTPLEAEFSAKLIKYASCISRKEANEIVRKLVNLYEKDLYNPPKGKPYTSCFDIKTGYPTKEYREFYNSILNKLQKYGISLGK